MAVMMDAIKKAFWETAVLFYRRPYLLGISLLTIAITAFFVWLFRPKEVFVEHLKVKVGIPLLAGLSTFVLIFLFMLIRAPFNEISELQWQLKISQQRERAAWNAKQTAEFQLQAARDDCGKLRADCVSQPKAITRIGLSAPGGQHQPDRSAIDAAIRAIGDLAEKGTAIQQAWIRSNDDNPLMANYTKWVTDCEAVLKSLDNPGYAIQFKNSHGSAMMGCPDAHTVNGCGYWQEINAKNQLLMSVITELRQNH